MFTSETQGHELVDQECLRYLTSIRWDNRLHVNINKESIY